MRRSGVFALYGLLLVAAFVIAWATKSPTPSSPTPSVDNPGHAGLKALFVYLQAHAAPDEVEALRAGVDALPPQARTLVAAAPRGRGWTSEEARALEKRVEAGLDFIYLAPGDLSAQPQLEEWLGLQRGEYLDPAPQASATGPDPLGTDVPVWQAVGPLGGAHVLRAEPDRGLKADDADWVPVAGKHGVALALYRRVGKGSVLVFAGPGVAENRHLALGDNLLFWRRVAAKGPLYFEEAHQTPPPSLGFPRVLAVVLLQGFLCALVWAWWRSARLGPPRPTLLDAHRSRGEYLQALAQLTRRARVEPELVQALKQHLRRLLVERLGLPFTLSELEVGRELARRGLLEEESYRVLMGELTQAGASPTDARHTFARLSARVAQLEARIEGR